MDREREERIPYFEGEEDGFDEEEEGGEDGDGYVECCYAVGIVYSR